MINYGVRYVRILEYMCLHTIVEQRAYTPPPTPGKIGVPLTTIAMVVYRISSRNVPTVPIFSYTRKGTYATYRTYVVPTIAIQRRIIALAAVGEETLQPNQIVHDTLYDDAVFSCQRQPSN